MHHGTIVPAAEGRLVELLVADLDGDGDVDAVAGFDDGPARLYRRDGDAFTRDPDWEAGGGYLTSLDLCDLGGDGGRELVVAGFTGVRVYRLLAGEVVGELFGSVPVGSTDVACGDLDGDGKDELALVSLDMPLVIVDGDGTQVWRSDVDLEPPASYQAFGADAGDLDGDGDVDLVVSGDPASEPKDIHLFWNDGGQPFDLAYERVPDLLAGHDMRGAEMTWLPELP